MKKVETLEQQVASGIAAATNAFTDIFTQRITVSDQFCIGSTCINENQLQALLANANINSNAGAGAEQTTDTTPPVIIVVGANPAEIALGMAYSDNGATVTDNVDSNLGYQTYLDGVFTSAVALDTSVAATHTVSYVATDNAGNTATSTRTVIVGGGEQATDTTPPLITLVGSSTVEMLQGDTYADAGATATDDTDGDITAQIVVTNPVDAATLGAYTVRYNVTDAAGNAAAEAARTVNVVATTTPQT
ncbi:MAG: DUF5011 domain-containing protein [Parcubacteria group bacterium]|nr:DUF5011 domain-containing protein [Parcubacteria group bacterium]